MAKKLPCPCGERTVPGLVKGVSLCPKHFNGLFYAPWYSHEHKEAKVMYHRNFTRNKQESSRG